MPRCQRTFRYLGPAVRGTWTCPHCPEAEVYSVVRERELWEYARWAQAQAIADFGAPQDMSWRFLLLDGLRPECIREPGDQRYDIYLAPDSDPFQQRLQIGHEMLHRIVGEGHVFHWAHEMLACVFSVRLLRLAGYTDYTARMEHAYAEEAAYCPTALLLSAAPWETAIYPEGYYGRAFVTGEVLERIVGYMSLCRLARTLSPRTGQPDVTLWMQSLNDGERNAVLACLSG